MLLRDFEEKTCLVPRDVDNVKRKEEKYTPINGLMMVVVCCCLNDVVVVVGAAAATATVRNVIVTYIPMYIHMNVYPANIPSSILNKVDSGMSQNQKLGKIGIILKTKFKLHYKIVVRPNLGIKNKVGSVIRLVKKQGK